MTTLLTLHAVPDLDEAISAIKNYCESDVAAKESTLTKLIASEQYTRNTIWTTVGSLLMFYEITRESTIEPYRDCLIQLYELLLPLV